MEKCLFSGAHDDAINLHGTHLRVTETFPERREIKVRFIHHQTVGFPAFLAVGAKSTTNLRVTGNTIHADAKLDDDSAIRTRDCAGVVIENNTHVQKTE